MLACKNFDFLKTHKSCCTLVAARFTRMTTGYKRFSVVTKHYSSVPCKTAATVSSTELVCQCQEALNDISTRHVVGLYWVPGHAGVRGKEIADGLASDGSALGFLGSEPVLGVSRRVIRTKLNQPTMG